MVEHVLTAHNSRQQAQAEVFASIDADKDGVLDRSDLERYIRKHLVSGREQGGYVFRRQDGVDNNS